MSSSYQMEYWNGLFEGRPHNSAFQIFKVFFYHSEISGSHLLMSRLGMICNDITMMEGAWNTSLFSFQLLHCLCFLFQPFSPLTPPLSLCLSLVILNENISIVNLFPQAGLDWLYDWYVGSEGNDTWGWPWHFSGFCLKPYPLLFGSLVNQSQVFRTCVLWIFLLVSTFFFTHYSCMLNEIWLLRPVKSVNTFWSTSSSRILLACWLYYWINSHFLTLYCFLSSPTYCTIVKSSEK